MLGVVIVAGGSGGVEIQGGWLGEGTKVWVFGSFVSMKLGGVE